MLMNVSSDFRLKGYGLNSESGSVSGSGDLDPNINVWIWNYGCYIIP